MFTALLLILVLVSFSSMSESKSTYFKIKNFFTTFGKDHYLISKTPLEKAADLPRQTVEKAKEINNEVC